MNEEKQNILIPNSTQIPNIISDLIMPRISEAEMRCLHYICRRTYGFHKERDRISLSQFINGIKNCEERRLDYGAGLSRPSVVEALKNLLGADLIRIIPTPKGNYYEINLELFRNKDNKEIEKTADKVVKKVNQLRKNKGNKPKQSRLFKVVKEVNQLTKLTTKSGKVSKPEGVKKVNRKWLSKLTHKTKRNKEKQSIISDKPMELKINPLKELISYFFELKGWAHKSKDFYKENQIVYARFTKPAKDLLKQAQSLEKAKNALSLTKEWADEKKLDWMIETSLRKWFDFFPPEEDIEIPEYQKKGIDRYKQIDKKLKM